MSTIREDVVSIGFEVENDPCADLTAGMDEIRAELGTLTSVENGLNDIGRSAASAANQMDSLTNSIHAPPDMGNPLSGLTEGLESVAENSSAIDQLNDGLNETGDNASDAGRQVDDLADGLRGLSVDDVVAGTKKLASGVVKVGSTLAHPKRSIKELADNAKKFAKEKLDAGVKKLPAPLQIAVTVSGALLGKLKQIAGVQLGKVASGVKKIGESAVGAGKTAAKGVANGMVAATKATAGIGKAAIKVGSNFESSMSQVAATMGMSADQANYSNEKYAKLAKTAKEMGASTKFSASESAEALNYMALAGYDADKACGALPTVLNLASAGGMDLASASDMVTDSMPALGLKATEAGLTVFGDKMAKAAQKSNTSVAQMGEAILTVGGTAKTLAGGTTELNTLLGIIADNGVKGAEGGTALRNIMLSLQAPTDTAAKKMKNLGLNVYTSEGKMRPMNKILQDLNASMDGMSDQKKQDILSTIFNKNDLKSVNALLANSGERYDELSNEILHSGGAMKNMADTMNDNLTGRITEFQSATEGAGIAIYEALGSSNLKDAVQKASGWMSDLTKATEEGGLSGLAEALGTVAGNAITEVTAHLPKLIDTGTQIIQSLLTGIDQNRDQIAQGLVSGLTSGITGLLQITPQILTVGVAMFSSLLQGMESQTPGTAIASQVLYGKTAWVAGKQITGSMPNKGAWSYSGLSGGSQVAIPKGYHDGTGIVSAVAPDSLESQTPATATASKLLSGETAWVKGKQIVGTMPDQNSKDSLGGFSYSYPNIPIHKGSNRAFTTTTGSGERLLAVRPGKGYWDGSTYVSVPAQSKSIAPTTSQQIVSADSGSVLEDVTISAIPT